jgi:hypothetical protein
MMTRRLIRKAEHTSLPLDLFSGPSSSLNRAIGIVTVDPDFFDHMREPVFAETGAELAVRECL